MTVLAIILLIFLVLFLLSLFRVKLTAKYEDKPIVIIKVFFLKFKFPSEKKAKKKKPKKKKSSPKKKKTDKKQEKEKKQSKSPLKQLWDKKGLTGLLDILNELLALSKGVLKGFFNRLLIHNFDVKITVGGEDASDTALGYGTACAVVYPLMGRLYNALNIEDYTVDVQCDFSEDSKTTVYAYAFGTIRIIHIIIIAIKALFRALKTYLKMKF
ncbi:MAG: DUF2953 domain-containing protein [Oscillospiraceae bacterium]|nr:DUF2953 domain-containing protein [Oscillospiraceae bacterium]